MAVRRKRTAQAVILSAYLLVGALASPSQGEDCDCQQLAETCEAAISVAPTGSAKGLYGADLTIRTNAMRCAKVEYLVDNTPAFTVLKHGGVDTDRIVGTSDRPFSSKRVTLQACHVCRAPSQEAGSQWPANCPPPEYPKRSVRNEEQGVTGLDYTLDGSGHVEQVTVVASSGSQYLDAASADALKACAFPSPHGAQRRHVDFEWHLE